MSAQVKDDGGPAFPFPVSQRDDGMILEGPWNGMTLRDYFAAKAMQAIIGSVSSNQSAVEALFQTAGERNRGDVIGLMAYEFADSMLEARKK